MEETCVLIVDDDPDLRDFLSGELGAEGHSCLLAGSGQDALLLIRKHAEIGLVLLDWTLPDFNGVEVCKRLRASRLSTPILMLTAHDEVKERVEALDAGADDFLTKPFSIEELLARVRAQLRRAQQLKQRESAGPLQLEDLTVNPETREVQRAGRIIHLTAREYQLLLFFMECPNKVHGRAEILENVWGMDFIGDPSLLDVYIRYLRRKIELPGESSLIQTIRGVGFMLKPGEPRH